MRRVLILVVAAFLLTPVGATAWVAPAAPMEASGLVIEALGESGESVDGEDLVDALLGTGVTIVEESVVFTGDAAAAGIFSSGQDALGIESGIVLSSGQVVDAVGPNDSGSTSTNFCGVLGSCNNGDTDLTSLAGFNTWDAAVLEFDFISDFNTVVFRYVFTSEEYNEFSNRPFNNVFGFFIGPPSLNDNFALLPGTTIPVAINNVNGGNSTTCTDTVWVYDPETDLWFDTGVPIDNDGDGDANGDDEDCTSANPNIVGEGPQNVEFFINNDYPPADPLAIDIEADGLTVVLEFVAQVTPGATNHMKLAIADASDAVYDSWVFIETASFSSAITNKVDPGDDVEAFFDFGGTSANFEFEKVNEPFDLTVVEVPFECAAPPRASSFSPSRGIIPFDGGEQPEPLCALYRVINPPDEDAIFGLIETRIAWLQPSPDNPRLLRADDADSLFEDITTGFFPNDIPGEDPGLRGGSRGLSDFMPVDWDIPDDVVFSGFGNPLGGRKMLRARAGRAIPVQFSLVDDDTGAPVADAVANITVTKIVEGGVEFIADVTPAGHSNDGNLFRANKRGKYLYNLKTKGLEPGIYVIAVTTNPFVMSPKTIAFEIR